MTRAMPKVDHRKNDWADAKLSKTIFILSPRDC
jgi:hypothetical protein